MTLLNDDEIATRLQSVPGWDRDEAQIVRDLEFKDFAAAMAFVNEVAELAEERNHHPDIGILSWNKVRLQVTNHSAGGLTEADFELAGAIDGLLAQ